MRRKVTLNNPKFRDFEREIFRFQLDGGCVGGITPVDLTFLDAVGNPWKNYSLKIWQEGGTVFIQFNNE